MANSSKIYAGSDQRDFIETERKRDQLLEILLCLLNTEPWSSRWDIQSEKNFRHTYDKMYGPL